MSRVGIFFFLLSGSVCIKWLLRGEGWGLAHGWYDGDVLFGREGRGIKEGIRICIMYGCIVCSRWLRMSLIICDLDVHSILKIRINE
jgi:hypothetical protein